MGSLGFQIHCLIPLYLYLSLYRDVFGDFSAVVLNLDADCKRWWFYIILGMIVNIYIVLFGDFTNILVRQQ
jgi:hypothetical protein